MPPKPRMPPEQLSAVKLQCMPPKPCMPPEQLSAEREALREKYIENFAQAVNACKYSDSIAKAMRKHSTWRKLRGTFTKQELVPGLYLPDSADSMMQKLILFKHFRNKKKKLAQAINLTKTMQVLQ